MASSFIHISVMIKVKGENINIRISHLNFEETRVHLLIENDSHTSQTFWNMRYSSPSEIEKDIFWPFFKPLKLYKNIDLICLNRFLVKRVF